MPLADIARGGLAQTNASISVASLTTLTLTSAQMVNRSLTFTGLLTGNCVVTISCAAGDAGASWVVTNGTTGAFTLAISGPFGAVYNVPQGRSTQVLWSGSSMIAGESVAVRSDYAIVSGITGASPTVVLAAAQYNATVIALQGNATGTPVIQVPNGFGLWLFNNQLAVAVNVQTAGGNPASVPSGSNHWIFIDGNSDGGNANAV
jgi:hypothetical protein